MHSRRSGRRSATAGAQLELAWGWTDARNAFREVLCTFSSPIPYIAEKGWFLHGLATILTA